ncbi:MAG TPA: heme exporter protein CcmD [Parvibaculum sp.]|jgi:heme exporter protein D
MSMAQYLDMGGYAAFVWPAYAVAAIIMLGIVIASWRDLTRQRGLLAALEGDGARKRAPARSMDHLK